MKQSIFSSFFLKYLKNRGIQILLLITLYLLIGKELPVFFHRGLYTLSTIIKECIVWVLPIIIFFFVAHTISPFEKKAPLFIIFVIILEMFSNLSCIWYGYFSGKMASDFLPPLKLVSENCDFKPLWDFSIYKPFWWSADKGVIIGVVIGSISALCKNNFIKESIIKGKVVSQWILINIFSRLIPFFILGFIAKIYQTKMLDNIFKQCGLLILWLLLFLGIYLIILFVLGSSFSFKTFVQSIRNLIPATTVAFTSGSSLFTMPWTIKGTAKNLKNPDFANAVIPLTTNVQQVGDCITQTFFCFLLFNNFYGYFPSLIIWLNFSIIFALARFATAAILGGAIFIMLPIYEKYLFFNPEMIAIILAFNVILDPIITSCNVIGNGAMCQIYEKGWSFFIKKVKIEKTVIK
jgi:Na+/H+-dicarboxylate symporter